MLKSSESNTLFQFFKQIGGIEEQPPKIAGLMIPEMGSQGVSLWLEMVVEKYIVVM